MTFRTSIKDKEKLIRSNEPNVNNSTNSLFNITTINEREKFLTMMETVNTESSIKSTCTAVDKFLTKTSTDMGKNAKDSLSLIKDLEEQLTSTKSAIHNLKRREMDRIFKEFLLYDYERRFGVKKEVVISALIGEDNIPSELSRQMREKKV
jgi:hypothetical protein